MNDTEVNDQPQAVRAGEELDANRLTAYLKAANPELDGPLTLAQFPHGFSNLTYLVKVGEHEIILRRPPFGIEIKSAHDMEREFRVLSGLIKVYPKVPRPLLYCNDLSVMNAPFYLMERVKGVVLRSQAPEELNLTPETMRRLSEAFINNFADIHRLDYTEAGLVNLGKPQGYIQRQISGWTQRYFKAKTDEIPEVEQVAAWLAEHLPPEVGPTMIHNDYKYDNVILDPENIANVLAVLDWEMATIGDPLMDLGTSLAYWIEAGDTAELQSTRFGLTTLPGNLTRAEVVQRYSQRSGLDVSNITFYYAYGLFKLAVVSQQLYLRYKLGHTTEERFARIIHSVGALCREALRVIHKEEL